MDLASSPVFFDDGRLKGSALVVFLTKGKVPMTKADITGNNGQRDWDSKFPELEKTVAPEQVEGVVRKLQHGYRGDAADQAAVVKLFEKMQIPAEQLVTYYEHCRSMQRDLGMLAEEDVDYQDLFCDKRRAKIFSEEFGFPCTFAAVADVLRLHPALMEATWNAANAQRDADRLWRDAAGDVKRFTEMLQADSSLTDDERKRLAPRALVQDKRLYVNYTANFLLIGRCRGPLARNLRIKGAALKALAEVGVSSAVRAVLSRALRGDASGLRGQLDPAADAGSSAPLQTPSHALQALGSEMRRETVESLQQWFRETGFEEALSAAVASPALRDALQSALAARDEGIVRTLGRQNEQLSLKVLFAMQQSVRSLVSDMKASVSQAVCFSLSQKFKDVRDEIRDLVTRPAGPFIDALRKAVKLPAVKRSIDDEKFPEEQRATPDEERFAESLSALLTEELERLASQSAVALAGKPPSLTYGAWKRCRNLVGSRTLALRKLDGRVSKPLLWSTSSGPGSRFNGGGQHYVYLKECRSSVSGNAKEYLRKVLKQKLKPTRASPTVEEHIRRLIASTTPEFWPVSSSSVDAFQHDVAEEKLGVQMEE